MAVSTAGNARVDRHVEELHIDHIPAGARHGKPWHQFAFWFGSNVCVFNVVVGAVTVSIGLTFWQALIVIAAGTLIGALLVALHATQGPRLGVPQTIQSRGQFGFYGSAFMFPAVLLINVGYIAAELVIQAQALAGATSALTLRIMVCSARIFLSVGQHPCLTWCGTRMDLSTLPGPGAVS